MSGIKTAGFWIQKKKKSHSLYGTTELWNLLDDLSTWADLSTYVHFKKTAASKINIPTFRLMAHRDSQIPIPSSAWTSWVIYLPPKLNWSKGGPGYLWQKKPGSLFLKSSPNMPPKNPYIHSSLHGDTNVANWNKSHQNDHTLLLKPSWQWNLPIFQIGMSHKWPNPGPVFPGVELCSLDELDHPKLAHN